ncbi:unnamed protein product [Symbiodinium sp. CCMP2592]|nr:unnamed protein product [Symbiodinium sp. CCMP2592]
MREKEFEVALRTRSFLHAVTLATACSSSALCSEKPVSQQQHFAFTPDEAQYLQTRLHTTHCSARPARVQCNKVKQALDLLAGTCLSPGSAMAEQGNANLGLAALSVAFLFGILGLFAFFALRAKTAAEEEEKQEKQQAAGGQRRRGALDRMQRGAARAAGSGEADEDEPEDQAGNKKANAAKEQKKQEKRAQQQAEREAYQQKQDKKAQYAQKQQARDAERMRRDAEDEQARKEKEKQEKEELDKWKEMFAVEYEGEDDAATAGESALEQFIDYVKLRKVVNLEDLAAEFRMRTCTAINRLEELEKMGRLSGIFDDRGKYIYITAEEMGEVAAWLKRKGRVNRAELVAGCNKLIRLDPTAEDKAKLEAEVRTAEEKLEGAEEVAQ